MAAKMYTEPKKQDTRLFYVTLPNTNQILKFFPW